MNLLNSYILVRQVKRKETEGFELAEAVNELIGKGEVVKVPQHDKEFKSGFPPIGSIVYFEKSLGTEFEINGEKVKFVKLEDVMGYE